MCLCYLRGSYSQTACRLGLAQGNERILTTSIIVNLISTLEILNTFYFSSGELINCDQTYESEIIRCVINLSKKSI